MTDAGLILAANERFASDFSTEIGESPLLPGSFTAAGHVNDVGSGHLCAL
ncbi:MAG TPA: hypothetical protein VK926_04180 [Gaiellaceae bacterium]|nr:hypothetical protein [Gaiellaceae bacterium]